MKKSYSKFLIPLVIVGATLTGGCNSSTSGFIDHVNVSISPDLSTISVAMIFASSVQSNFSGTWDVKSYGELYMDPYTSTEPFTVGFTLNTSVLNDQDYVQITPTTTLPNGVLIGIGYPLVEIQPVTPISSQFDLYGYVDVTHFDWLGVAGMFAIADKYFPTSLSVNQVLLRDSAGLPEVIGAAFGPVFNNDGSVARQAGVALFANVNELIQSLINQPNPNPSSTPSPTPSAGPSPSPASIAQYERQLRIVPTEEAYVTGPGADKYQGHPDLIHSLLEGFAKIISGK